MFLDASTAAAALPPGARPLRAVMDEADEWLRTLRDGNVKVTPLPSIETPDRGVDGCEASGTEAVITRPWGILIIGTADGDEEEEEEEEEEEVEVEEVEEDEGVM